MTICVVNAVKTPSSLVVANFGPRGNALTAKTPHKLLVDYMDTTPESNRFQLQEATHLVHFATRHVPRRDISFTENWSQWIIGQCYSPMLQTQDTDLLIAGRLGNCADRCQILKSIAERSGKRCRFVGLSGHVVLEVEVDGKWNIADPDYNVTYPMEVQELARPQNETLMHNSLRLWYTPTVVDQYIQIVQSTENNLQMPTGSPLSPRLYLAEQICKWLSWLVPVLLLFSVVPWLRSDKMQFHASPKSMLP